MKSYVLSWNGSGATTEIYAETDEEAIDQARTILGDDVLVCWQWDADGVNDDGESCKRLLIWSNEADAEDDCGAKALAQLSTVGQVS